MIALGANPKFCKNFGPFGRDHVKLNTQGGVPGAKCLGGGSGSGNPLPRISGADALIELTELTKRVLAVL